MDYKRISKYYTGCDGTKIAVDLYLPQTDKKVPVLLKAGYGPRRQIDEMPPEKKAIERFVDAEYAVAIVEVRGAGASMGVSDGFFTTKDARDMACLIDTMTHEDWCSGKAGMYGGSNHGMIQEITACEQPENLLAVIPCDCSMDFYYQNFPNGVSAMPDMKMPHHAEVQLGTPVDEDPAPDYPMAHEAAVDHERNKPFLFQHFHNMWRDDLHPALGYRPNLEIPSWEKMDTVRFGHITTWNTGAWFDPGCTNKILTYKSWGGRLIIGPWPHCGIYRNDGTEFPNMAFDWPGEYIRFFDAILKEKNPETLDEPPVYYYTVGDEGHEWHMEADFPVSGTLFTSFYFGGAGSSAADSSEAEKEMSGSDAAKDGNFLGLYVPSEGKLDYRVREDVMIYERWMRMNRNVQKDEREEDAKSLVFTSDVFPKDTELTGIPKMEIYVTSSHKDGNFIVALEEVTEDGFSHFITDGFIRASHAKVHPNGVYASMGLEYHRGYREDAVWMSETEPLRLSFQLEAFSRIIKKGSRLRIAISCGGSGMRQPEGFPEEMPTISLYTGAKYPSRVILPVIKPTATEFSDGKREVFAYRKAVYIREDGRFKAYPCEQVYPLNKDTLRYQTKDFYLDVRTEGLKATAKMDADALPSGSDLHPSFAAETELKDRFVPETGDREMPFVKRPWSYYPPRVDRKNIYVATVPVRKGDPGNMNPQLCETFDIMMDLVYPEGKREEGTKLPLIINIHGFGGSHHQFETNTEMFLERGFAVASVDYRLCPPNTWPASDDDVRGCIRYLKAHADELGLDRDRFGVIGGSMGGNLTSMITASNGEPDLEGNIGGNTEYDSSVKAGAAYFAFTDFEHFGDDSAQDWPAQPDKVNNSDGPFAPIGSLLGYVGKGRGFGVLKSKRYHHDPEVDKLLAVAAKASPVNHVTADSAPLALVHGLFDCNIQVPMGQSIRMFREYAKHNIKCLLLCNTCGIYGEDPEVKKAVVEFMTTRI